MFNHLAVVLSEAVERETAFLRSVADHDAGFKRSANAWSKKEELGHLIDSATNNHVRFVRATIEPEFHGPGYEQNKWVDVHGYQSMPWTQIVDFWEHYNHFLVELVGRIPENRLSTQCIVGQSEPVTLQFLIEDYVLHMQHHLDHILEREKITAYPGAALGV